MNRNGLQQRPSIGRGVSLLHHRRPDNQRYFWLRRGVRLARLSAAQAHAAGQGAGLHFVGRHLGAMAAPLILVGFNYPGYPVLGIIAMMGFMTAVGIYLNEMTLRHRSSILAGSIHGALNRQGYGIWGILFPSVNPLLSAASPAWSAWPCGWRSACGQRRHYPASGGDGFQPGEVGQRLFRGRFRISGWAAGVRTPPVAPVGQRACSGSARPTARSARPPTCPPASREWAKRSTGRCNGRRTPRHSIGGDFPPTQRLLDHADDADAERQRRTLQNLGLQPVDSVQRRIEQLRIGSISTWYTFSSSVRCGLSRFGLSGRSKRIPATRETGRSCCSSSAWRAARRLPTSVAVRAV